MEKIYHINLGTLGVDCVISSRNTVVQLNAQVDLIKSARKEDSASRTTPLNVAHQSDDSAAAQNFFLFDTDIEPQSPVCFSREYNRHLKDILCKPLTPHAAVSHVPLKFLDQQSAF